jgi:hypothetical protein
VPAVGTLPVPLAAATVPATPEPDVEVPALPESVVPDTPPPLTAGMDCPGSLPPQAASQHPVTIVNTVVFEVRILQLLAVIVARNTLKPSV